MIKGKNRLVFGGAELLRVHWKLVEREGSMEMLTGTRRTIPVSQCLGKSSYFIKEKIDRMRAEY